MNMPEKDVLGTLFGRMSHETLPAGFRSNLMEKIRMEAVRMQKRRERYELLAIIAASILLIAAAVVSVGYYGSLGADRGVFRGILSLFRVSVPDLPPFSDCAFPLFIGGLILVLLVFDYFLRKTVGKNRQKSASNGL